MDSHQRRLHSELKRFSIEFNNKDYTLADTIFPCVYRYTSVDSIVCFFDIVRLGKVCLKYQISKNYPFEAPHLEMKINDMEYREIILEEFDTVWSSSYTVKTVVNSIMWYLNENEYNFQK